MDSTLIRLFIYYFRSWFTHTGRRWFDRIARVHNQNSTCLGMLQRYAISTEYQAEYQLNATSLPLRWWLIDTLHSIWSVARDANMFFFSLQNVRVPATHHVRLGARERKHSAPQISNGLLFLLRGFFLSFLSIMQIGSSISHRVCGGHTMYILHVMSLGGGTLYHMPSCVKCNGVTIHMVHNVSLHNLHKT